MPQRRLAALTALLSAALTVGLSGCAQTIDGSPVAGAPGVEEPTSGKPTATVRTKPAGKVKITTKKKLQGYDVCGLLTPADIAQAIGATANGPQGCFQTTTDPFGVVLVMLAPAEVEGEATETELGGNTAYRAEPEPGTCSIHVVLSDDSHEFTPALLVSVTAAEGTDSCAIAHKLATTAFGKIPNA